MAAVGLTADELDCSLGSVYDYRDEKGELLYQVCRYEPKDFRVRRPDGNGNCHWGLNGVPRVPYRLPELRARPAGEPVFLVEGEKDADNIAALGLIATTTLGGAKPKWLPVYTESLRGAHVVILPDNDKPGRTYAENAAKALHGVAESIKIVALPGLPSKGDVSDLIAAGGTRDTLLDLARSAPLWQPTAGQEENEPAKADEPVWAPFLVRDGAFYWRRPTKDGAVPVRLCNFEARVAEDIKLDDGSGETNRRFMIHSAQFGPAEVPVKQFASLAWVVEQWGVRAIVEPGLQTKGQLVAAIQHASTAVKERTIYVHLGWRKFEGRWVYLHAGGAVGTEGAVEGIEVRPERALADYTLSVGTDLATAVRGSLRVLDVGPPRIVYPLLGAIYRAPLAEFAPVSVSLFFAGDSGTRKSALCGIAQAHFGPAFGNGKHFPGNWSGTANSLERAAFLAKDALFTIDDFVPKGTSYDIHALHKTADRLLRGQGNLAGRSRMTAEGASRPEMYPRGLIIASGEDVPSGKSLRARMVVVEFEQSDVNNTVLTELQQAATSGRLVEAMAGYLQWQAGRAETLRDSLPARQGVLRAAAAGTHARTPENTALLLVGLEEFFTYAVTVGVMTHKEREVHLQTAVAVFNEQAEAQDRHIRDEDPVEYFLELLRGVLVAGRGHLADPDEPSCAPPGAESCGWRKRTVGAGDNIRDEWYACGDGIGWVQKDDLYLEPSAAYAVVERLAREQQKSLPIQPKTLWKRLHERGLMLRTEPGRHQARHTCAGVARRVVHLSTGLVLEAKLPSVPAEQFDKKF